LAAAKGVEPGREVVLGKEWTREDGRDARRAVVGRGG